MIAKGRSAYIRLRLGRSKHFQKGSYTELAVVLDGFLVILFNVIREVVDRDVVMFDIFHDLDRK